MGIKAALGGLLLGVVIGGCSATPQELEANTAARTQVYPENYQEIYRRVSAMARQCMAGNVSAYASMAVDADLFPDLNRGEIKVSLINWGARNYYASARIERTGAGAQMTVQTGNTLAAERMRDNFFAWGSGSQNC